MDGTRNKLARASANTFFFMADLSICPLNEFCGRFLVERPERGLKVVGAANKKPSHPAKSENEGIQGNPGSHTRSRLASSFSLRRSWSRCGTTTSAFKPVS